MSDCVLYSYPYSSPYSLPSPGLLFPPLLTLFPPSSPLIPFPSHPIPLSSLSLPPIPSLPTLSPSLPPLPPSSPPSLPLSTLPSLREAYRNGTLTSEGVRRVLKLEPNKMGKIADFFVREISEAVPRAPLVSQEKEKEREREKSSAGVSGMVQYSVWE